MVESLIWQGRDGVRTEVPGKMVNKVLHINFFEFSFIIEGAAKEVYKLYRFVS
jgi:hypothetical protein